MKEAFYRRGAYNKPMISNVLHTFHLILKSLILDSLVLMPNLMYYWAHMEVPTLQPVTPGRLLTSVWPPDKDSHTFLTQDNQRDQENNKFFSQNNNEEISDINEARIVISQLKKKLQELEYQLEKYRINTQIETLNKNLEKQLDSLSDYCLNKNRTELSNKEVQTSNANEQNKLSNSKAVINLPEYDPLRTNVNIDKTLDLSSLEHKSEMAIKDIMSKPDVRSDKIVNYCKLNKSRESNNTFKKDELSELKDNIEGTKQSKIQFQLGFDGSEPASICSSDASFVSTNVSVDLSTYSAKSYIDPTLINDEDVTFQAGNGSTTKIFYAAAEYKIQQLSTEDSQTSLDLNNFIAESKILGNEDEVFEIKLEPVSNTSVFNECMPLTDSLVGDHSTQVEPKASSQCGTDPPPPMPGMSPPPPPMPGTLASIGSELISIKTLHETNLLPTNSDLELSMSSKANVASSTSEIPSSSISDSNLPTNSLSSATPPSSIPAMTASPQPTVPTVSSPPPPFPDKCPSPVPEKGSFPTSAMGPPPIPGVDPLTPPIAQVGLPPPLMSSMGPPPPPMPRMEPPSPHIPEMGPPPSPIPGMGTPPAPPMAGMGPPPPPMPGMGPPPPPMPGMGPPPPPMPGMGPPPPPMPGLGPPPPPPPPGMGGPPPPPSMPGTGPPPPPPSGPLPFPAPPIGGWNVQRATLRKTPVKPAAPMKPLYWTRILAPPIPTHSEISSNIKPLWLEIEEAKLDNIEEFTDLFSRQVVKAPVKKKVEVKTKILPVKILDSKRSQNVGILAQSLHVEFSEIENAIYNFDTSVVSLEALQQIYELRGTEEELSLIKNHLMNNSDIPLDRPEAFLYDLSGIPNFAERISCFMFQAEFEDAVSTTMHKLDNLKHTCEFLMTSEPLKKLFAIILTLGNYMNGGNGQRGQADGFGLEILSKLKDVKSKQSNVTLLHFIVRTYMNGVGGWSLAGVLPVPEPGDVVRAAALDFAEVAAHLATLRKQLDECKEKTKKVLETDAQTGLEEKSLGDESKRRLEVFKDKMTAFLNAAEEKIKTENENLEECRNKFIATVKFYQYTPKCGKVEDCEPKEFFSLWTLFCSDFKDIYKKEEQIAIKEKLKEAKKLQEERKPITQPKKEGGLKARLQKLSSTTSRK